MAQSNDSFQAIETTLAATLTWTEDNFPIVDHRDDDRPRTIRKLSAKGDTNTKLRKSAGHGFRTIGLSLAPSKESGIGNTCPHASTGCAGSCLDHQGLASVFEMIRRVRIAKTAVFYLARDWFLETLARELQSAVKSTVRDNLLLAARLNVFSDIPWERLGIIEQFPNIQFYDYTKNPKRAGLIRPNYWVTFSRSETNQEDCLRLLAEGKNVAIPFDSGRTGNQVTKQASADDLPKTWYGFPVIDGDTTDLRFDDPRGRSRGRVVGLRLKAASRAERLKALDSGFAIPRRGHHEKDLV